MVRNWNGKRDSQFVLRKTENNNMKKTLTKISNFSEAQIQQTGSWVGWKMNKNTHFNTNKAKKIDQNIGRDFWCQVCVRNTLSEYIKQLKLMLSFKATMSQLKYHVHLAGKRIPWRTRPASENVACSRHSDCGDGGKRCEPEKQQLKGVG